MQELLLPSDKIIVVDYLEYDAVVNIYAHLYRQGFKQAVPPVIVLPAPMLKTRFHSDLVASQMAGLESAQYVKIERQLLNTLEPNAYVLLEGNHRSTAAALVGVEIAALSIGVQADMHELDELVRAGKLISNPHAGKTLDELLLELSAYLWNKTSRVTTLQKRTQELVEEGRFSYAPKRS